MKLMELIKPGDVNVMVAYHDTLNPALWDDRKLKPEITKQLKDIAKIFEKFLNLSDIKIIDVVITGSSANFNWTEMSDIDIHLIADFSKLKNDCSGILKKYLMAMKKIWNDTHDIKIYGYEIETYVQDSKELHVATGIYSLTKNKWLIKPQHKKPKVNDSDVKVKTADLMNSIDCISNCQCDSLSQIEHIKNKIKRMRRAGLMAGGEFSTENIVFKTLRSNGYLEKLNDAAINAVNQSFSLE